MGEEIGHLVMMMSFVKNADIGFGRDREQNTHTHTETLSSHTFCSSSAAGWSRCGSAVNGSHFKHTDHQPGSDPHLEGSVALSVWLGKAFL